LLDVSAINKKTNKKYQQLMQLNICNRK